MSEIENAPITPFGYVLLFSLAACLLLAGWYSYKSIDWDVLKKLEATKLELPPKQQSVPLTVGNQESKPAQ